MATKKKKPQKGKFTYGEGEIKRVKKGTGKVLTIPKAPAKKKK